MQSGRFPLERIDEIMKRPEDFRLLERIPLTRPGLMDKLPVKLTDPWEDDELKTAVFIDTETTGMDPSSDRIIELSLVRCTYSFNRRVLLSIDAYYDEFEDPGRPIPPGITELTGITDEMVRGHHFDNDEVARILAGRPLLIAHNARFDRPMFDLRWPLFNNLAWACSMTEIDWDALGSGGRKLEYLVQSRGWFYQAHRAYIDCLAVIWLLHLEPDAMQMLLDSAIKRDYRLWAVGAPFAVKDELKNQGYRFDGARRTWYKNFPDKTAAEAALQKLFALFDASRCRIELSNAATRFKLS